MKIFRIIRQAFHGEWSRLIRPRPVELYTLFPDARLRRLARPGYGTIRWSCSNGSRLTVSQKRVPPTNLHARCRVLTRREGVRRERILPSSDPQQHPSLQTRLPAIERRRGRSEGVMAGDDEPIHDACLSPRSWPQGFPSTGRIHVDDAGAEELPEPSQRHRLRNTVVMPEGVKRLGDHQIGHDHLFTDDQRAFDPPTRDLHLHAWLTDQQAENHRGVKADGHWPIPGRCSDGCRSTDAISPWRSGEGNRPRTSRIPAPSGPTRSPSRRAGAPPQPSPRGRGRDPCRERPEVWLGAWW